jgi:Xaa-Pro dipeptidase
MSEATQISAPPANATTPTRSSIIGMELPFDNAEYAQRVERARKAMELERLDALLMFHQESMFYLFGYDQLGYWVYQTAILAAEDDKVTVVCRQADEDLVKGLPLVGDLRLWLDDADDDPVSTTVGALRDRNLLAAGRRIGIELRSHALLPFYYRGLAQALPQGVELVDASDLVTELRLRKSAAEVGYVRQAAAYLDAAYGAAFASLRPGVRENEVLAAAMSAALSAGGEVPAIMPPLASGPRTMAATHGAATNRALQSGDVFQLEVGGCCQRYHAVGVQSKWIGTAPDGVAGTYRVLKETIDLGIDAIRAGVTTSAVAATVNRALKSAGMYLPGRHIGYGTGIGYPPTWLDNLRVKETDHHTLEENMVLFFFLHHQHDANSLLFVGEPVLVTAAGAERLSATPLTLEVA